MNFYFIVAAESENFADVIAEARRLADTKTSVRVVQVHICGTKERKFTVWADGDVVFNKVGKGLEEAAIEDRPVSQEAAAEDEMTPAGPKSLLRG